MKGINCRLFATKSIFGLGDYPLTVGTRYAMLSLDSREAKQWTSSRSKISTPNSPMTMLV